MTRYLSIIICCVLHYVPVLAQAQPLSGGDWSRTVANVVQSVVSLELAYERSLDSDRQGMSTATGFVVDAERGLILTNRHVVGSGPLQGHATFANQERVKVESIYRDPLHDFGFLRYDPQALKLHKPKALALRADKVQIGTDIRVIGSDGGEQISILAGTIAKVDRAAPRYGRYHYNDFNTFYIQAASSTSGGSSGAPVVDIEGDVIALNAGANTRTAASFFMPLPIIEDALAALQVEREPVRVGMDTIFQFKPFSSLERLGLASAEIDRITAQSAATGLLTAGQVLLGGVADGRLQEGDILLSIDAQRVTDFLTFERLLAKLGAGKQVSVSLWRNDTIVEQTIVLQDLQAQLPRRFIELGLSVLHDPSFQSVRALHTRKRGVIVAEAGYLFSRAGVPTGALITEINGQRIGHLDAFAAQLAGAAVGDHWRFRFIVPGQEQTERLGRLELLTDWFDVRDCQRTVLSGDWQCAQIDLARAEASTPLQASSVANIHYGNALLDKIAPRLVQISYDIPHSADNIYANHFQGAGLLVDAERGLIIADRNTVPMPLGDARVIVFDAIEVTAKVVFLHPRHNLALLKIDPEVLAGLTLPPLNLYTENDFPQPSHFVGFGMEGELMLRVLEGANDEALVLPRSSLARFEQVPIDAYTLPTLPASAGGAILDADAQLLALWVSFAFDNAEGSVDQGSWGLPAALITDTLKAYDAQQPVPLLGWSPAYLPLAEAVQLGLPEAWLRRLLDSAGDKRRAIFVRQILSGTEAAEVLRPGDILLAVDDVPVHSFLALDQLLERRALTLSILRDGSVQTLTYQLPEVSGQGMGRVLQWGGAHLQQAPVEAGYYSAEPISGVYVSFVSPGSPAARDGLYGNRFITQVNGIPVHNLDEFIEIVMNRERGANVRLLTRYLAGHTILLAVRPDYTFWPTRLIEQVDNTWQVSTLRRQ